MPVIVVVIGVGLGAIIIARFLPGNSSCAVSPESFLPTTWFGAMVDMGGSDLDALPFRLAGTSTGFEKGHTSGYIAAVALDSPYRSQADAQASALGYQIGTWPLVPLSGDIVRDYPETLEAYQTHFVFSSSEAAAAFIAQTRDSSDPSVPLPSGAVGTLGEDATLFETAGDPLSGTETNFGLFFRLGDTVTQLSLRGGADLNGDYAVAAAGAAANQLAAQCGMKL